MASEDWPSARELAPEQQLAAVLVDRYGLAPPVDVVGLAQQFAELEEDDFPVRCDGLVVGLHGPRERPLILLRRTQGDARKRFTLAHEIGHILLPWHIGAAVACNTAAPLFDEEAWHAASAETEANRFAAELLIPQVWLDSQYAAHGQESAAAVLEAIKEAEVSAHVACLRLINTLPAGHTFAMTDSFGNVVLSGQTKGTGVPPPERGERLARLERRRLDKFASAVEEVRYGSNQITWWSFRGTDSTTGVGEDDRSAAEVLDALLADHGIGEAEARLVRQRLSGVIGYANGVARDDGVRDVDSLFVRFRGRFAKTRPLPDELLDDPVFELWIRKRAEELGE